MKKSPSLLLILGIFISITAWGSTPEFQYNTKTGKCVSASGKTGLNKFDPAIFKTEAKVAITAANVSNRIVLGRKVLDCTDLSDVKFDDYLRSPDWENKYIELENWSFRGSKFNKAQISFYTGTLAVQGTDLSEVEGGYVDFTLKTDKHTVMPTTGCQPTAKKNVFICRK